MVCAKSVYHEHSQPALKQRYFSRRWIGTGRMLLLMMMLLLSNSQFSVKEETIAKGETASPNDSSEIHWTQYRSLLERREGGHHCRRGLRRKIKRCSCPDPTKPTNRTANRLLYHHHKRMVQDIHYAASLPGEIDLVMLGDSIVERWNGTERFGKNRLPFLRPLFKSHFTKSGGGDLEGIALGTSGDLTTDVLFHLQNGLLIDSFNPKVWWILVGTNNFGVGLCNSENVIAGVLNVVKYMLEQKPQARIMIHGILPRTDELYVKPTTNLLPVGVLWEVEIKSVNTALRDFCNQHPGKLYYMEADDIFLEKDDNGKQWIPVQMMGDGLHPSLEAMRLWAPRIEERLKSVIPRNVIL